MTLPPLLVEGPLLPSPLPGRGWDLLPAHWPAEQGLSEAARRVLPIGLLPDAGHSCCFNTRQATWRPGTRAPEPTPFPIGCFWGPTEERGLEHQGAHSLPWDQVPPEGATTGTAGAETERKGPGPPHLYGGNPFSLGTWSGSQRGPSFQELCISNLETNSEGSSKFEVLTGRANPPRGDGEARPNYCVCNLRLHLLLP